MANDNGYILLLEALLAADRKARATKSQVASVYTFERLMMELNNE